MHNNSVVTLLRRTLICVNFIVDLYFEIQNSLFPMATLTPPCYCSLVVYFSCLTHSHGYVFEGFFSLWVSFPLKNFLVLISQTCVKALSTANSF